MRDPTRSTHPGRTNLVRGGIHRPQVVGRRFKQLVILLRDCSTSMDDDDKAPLASRGVRECLVELGKAKNLDGFRVTIIDFESDAETVLDGLSVEEALTALTPIQPRGWTNISAALEQAEQAIDTTRDEDVEWLRPVVLLFSDGENTKGPDPQPFADQLKPKADIVTIAFGDDANESALTQMASTPQHFYRIRSGAELLQFLKAAGETVTRAHDQRQNATQATQTIAN